MLPFGAWREPLSVRDIFSMCFHPRQPLALDLERLKFSPVVLDPLVQQWLKLAGCRTWSLATAICKTAHPLQTACSVEASTTRSVLVGCPHHFQFHRTTAGEGEENCASTGATVSGAAKLQVWHSGDFQKPFAPSPCFKNNLLLLLAARKTLWQNCHGHI